MAAPPAALPGPAPVPTPALFQPVHADTRALALQLPLQYLGNPNAQDWARIEQICDRMRHQIAGAPTAANAHALQAQFQRWNQFQFDLRTFNAPGLVPDVLLPVPNDLNEFLPQGNAPLLDSFTTLTTLTGLQLNAIRSFYNDAVQPGQPAAIVWHANAAVAVKRDILRKFLVTI
ncbi:uncharacterized protein JCM10292_000813 [Rhodotorula paludigena]|uniref:uncharacterized protein n=1 Tax=Rhodotorula paludigena TaxID=86838 RepID=UPI00317B2BD9